MVVGGVIRLVIIVDSYPPWVLLHGADGIRFVKNGMSWDVLYRAWEIFEGAATVV